MENQDEWNLHHVIVQLLGIFRSIQYSMGSGCRYTVYGIPTTSCTNRF